MNSINEYTFPPSPSMVKVLTMLRGGGIMTIHYSGSLRCEVYTGASNAVEVSVLTGIALVNRGLVDRIGVPEEYAEDFEINEKGRAALTEAVEETV